ncbi:MAG: RloB family protein, partial [Rhizonema sp. PD38]|nr:RloB family protein [Rhizonema sp. PD38]
MQKTSSNKSKGRGYHDRKVNIRDLGERFLIVCEGEKTEPNYFKSFRVPGKVVIDIRGLGNNTIGLVEEVVIIKNDAEYDQVWCVFDRDSFPRKDFNAALALATRENIQVAYSNEAFELWYLLHFHYYDT